MRLARTGRPERVRRARVVCSTAYAMLLGYASHLFLDLIREPFVLRSNINKNLSIF